MLDSGLFTTQDDQDDDFRINVVKMKSEPNSAVNLQKYNIKSKNLSQDLNENLYPIEKIQHDQLNKYSVGRVTAPQNRAQDAIINLVRM